MVSLDSGRRLVAERGRGRVMNVLPNRRIEMHSSPEKEIVIPIPNSKHSNGLCPVARHTQSLFFGEDEYQMSMHHSQYMFS